jgi:hypothetical protein
VLGVAAGSAFGLTAALMKVMTTAFSGGPEALFTTWQLYGMIAAGALGDVPAAVGDERRAADRRSARPDPLRPHRGDSVGILAFHEQVPGGLYIVLAVASGLIMAGAVLALARSPLIR